MMGLPRCSTVVLHRQNPAVRETPDFKGLFRCRKSVAEREGLSPIHPSPSKILVKQGLSRRPAEAVYHLRVPRTEVRDDDFFGETRLEFESPAGFVA
jgi:hypothetical protein